MKLTSHPTTRVPGDRKQQKQSLYHRIFQPSAGTGPNVLPGNAQAQLPFPASPPATSSEKTFCCRLQQ